MAAAPAELYRLWRGNDDAKSEAFSQVSLVKNRLGKDPLCIGIGVLKVYIWGTGGLGPSLVNCTTGSGFAPGAS